VFVAAGAPEAARRLGRVLITDPGMDVVCHADAGYELAIDTAQKQGIIMPMLKKGCSANDVFVDFTATTSACPQRALLHPPGPPARCLTAGSKMVGLGPLLTGYCIPLQSF
jgi:hypothetical protein